MTDSAQPKPPLSAPASGRVAFVDLARALAIVMVLVCHAADLAFYETIDGVRQLSPQITGFALLEPNILHTVGRIGVPLFLMITGYLLLDRTYDDAACKKFWKTRWIWLLLVTVAWTVIYALFACLLYGLPFDPVELLAKMLLFKPADMSHFWYMPMLLGFYLFIPVMANGLSHTDAKTLVMPVAIITILFAGVPTLSEFTKAYLGVAFSTGIYSGFSGGLYGVYMILGFMVRRRAFSAIPTGVVAAGAISMFLCTAGMQFVLCYTGHPYAVWYSNGFLLLLGLCLFELAARLKVDALPRLAVALSKYSFAIFLVHLMVMNPLALLLPKVLEPGLLPFAAYFVVTLPASLAISHVLAKTRVGRFLFYMK